MMMAGRWIVAVLSVLVVLGVGGCGKAEYEMGIPETFRLKVAGLPQCRAEYGSEGFYVEVKAQFVPDRDGPLSRSYWGVPATGHSIPMEHSEWRWIESDGGEITVPLIDRRLPFFRRWPFHRWRLDWISIRVTSDGYYRHYSVLLLPNLGHEHTVSLFNNGYAVDTLAGVSQLPDTLQWLRKDPSEEVVFDRMRRRLVYSLVGVTAEKPVVLALSKE